MSRKHSKSNGPKTPRRMNTLVQAVDNRQSLLETGKLSVPANVGSIAIWYSAYDREQLRTLARHAAQLKRRFSSNHEVDVLEKPTIEEVKDVITDPKIASVVVIGHGSFSTARVYAQRGEAVDNLTWYGVADTATHLKTGFFEQRTCAGIKTDDNQVRVALGSFLMADQSRILAPVGKILPYTAGLEEFDESIHPVYAKPNNSAAELIEPLTS